MNNLLSTAWYWKAFYWKLFSTSFNAMALAVIAGLSMADQAIYSTEVAIRIIFYLTVVKAGVLAIDTLVDQTLSRLSSNGHSTNGNGNGGTAAANTPQPH